MNKYREQEPNWRIQDVNYNVKKKRERERRERKRERERDTDFKLRAVTKVQSYSPVYTQSHTVT